MLQSISKSKIYFYLFLLILLPTTTNKSFLINITDFFKVKKIIINGTTEQQNKIIINNLNYLYNESIFKIDLQLIEKSLDKLNFYNSLYIKKIFPSNLKLNFNQTDLLGVFYKENKRYFIGNNNKIISTDNISSSKKLPTVFGKFEINEYIELVKVLEKNNIKLKMIQNIYYHKSGRWDFQLINAEYVMLPSKDLMKSIKIYKSFIKNNILKKIKSIDLRVENQISVIYE